MNGDLDFDNLLSSIEKGDTIPEQTISKILSKAQELLFQESTILFLKSPIVICGDLHGQLADLLHMFKTSESNEDHFSQTYLFLGDYVDRGYNSLNTFLYLIILKLKHPNQFYLLRGNHESRKISQTYGFYQECCQIYGHSGVWAKCNETFDNLPICALIDNDIFSVHGGLSPDLPILDLISLYDRQCEIPISGPISDLCWSDPEDSVTSWRTNMRGSGYEFGAPQVKQFLWLNGLKIITRAHQLAKDGFEWHFDKTLCTIWSAPNYQYSAGNDASIMKLRFPDHEEFYMEIFKSATERIIPQKQLPLSKYFL